MLKDFSFRDAKRGILERLVVVYGQRSNRSDDARPSSLVRDKLTHRIKDRIDAEGFNVQPLVDVTLFDR